MSFETFANLAAGKKEAVLAAGIRAFSEQAYADVSTDLITRQCGISKGILFHYFGSKKAFYLYCLETSMRRLTKNTPAVPEGPFYEVLFAEMEQKMERCRQYPAEMHMVNMASRDTCAETAKEKTELLGTYAADIRAGSLAALKKAFASMRMKEGCREETAVQAMHIYISALLNRYLLQYRDDPDGFFENSEKIRAEIKTYLDMMLYGICEKEGR